MGESVCRRWVVVVRRGCEMGRWSLCTRAWYPRCASFTLRSRLRGLLFWPRRAHVLAKHDCSEPGEFIADSVLRVEGWGHKEAARVFLAHREHAADATTHTLCPRRRRGGVGSTSRRGKLAAEALALVGEWGGSVRHPRAWQTTALDPGRLPHVTCRPIPTNHRLTSL